MKGVSAIISAILLVSIYSSLAIAAFQWGMPIIMENKDLTTINKAEGFLHRLDSKIGRVAKMNGIEEIRFDLPGKIYIEPENDTIRFCINTKRYKQYPENYTCISENCDKFVNSSELDSFFVLKVRLYKSTDRAITEYVLEPRIIKRGNDTYTLDIVYSGKEILVGESRTNIVIRNSGTVKKPSSDPNIDQEIKTFINITMNDLD